MQTIWEKVKSQAEESGRAFTILAPMEDVTDTVFRQIVQRIGRPTLFMTEFTNCDGLASRGRERVIHRFAYTQEQHPIIAQIWGRNPENYQKTVPTLIEMGFDGIDINMGCPVPKVIKSGAGAGLICNPELAKSLIESIREELEKSNHNVRPALSVKTRIGSQVIDLGWIEFLLKQPIDALTVHLRTTKELSKVPAHWELMPKIIELRDSLNPKVAVVGNGDITTREQLETYRARYGVDGLMVGRGIFENPWLFNETTPYATVSAKTKIEMLRAHLLLFWETWEGKKNFELMKKFFKIYLKGFEGASEIRNRLIVLKHIDDMLPLIDTAIAEYSDRE